jgi:hypothetical protein
VTPKLSGATGPSTVITCISAVPPRQILKLQILQWRRYLTEGPEGLYDLSHAPRTVIARIPPQPDVLAVVTTVSCTILWRYRSIKT